MKRGIAHNTHPGELLKEEILNANNLSITEAAKMLGVQGQPFPTLLMKKQQSAL